jgi:hypothetical protein
MPTYSPQALTGARIRKTRNEAEFIALKSSIVRGDHLNRAMLEAVLSDVTNAIRQIIEATPLTPGEKGEIYQNLGQIPITLAQARQDQRRALAKAEGEPINGDD